MRPMNVLLVTNNAKSLPLFCEGVSIRATERLTAHAVRDTIMRLGVRVGKGAQPSMIV